MLQREGNICARTLCDDWLNEVIYKQFFPHADNFPIRITRRETLNNHRRGNGIGSYRSSLILILLILALMPSVAAADTMFRASPERTGVFDNGGIAPNNTELWRFETRSNVRSSPALSNGVIYVGSDAVLGGTGTLHAIDAVTGMEKWRFKTKSNMRSLPRRVMHFHRQQYRMDSFTSAVMTGTCMQSMR